MKRRKEKVDMDDDEYRENEKVKMAVYVFWMLVIGWCIALHYFAYLGLMASIERM